MRGSHGLGVRTLDVVFVDIGVARLLFLLQEAEGRAEEAAILIRRVLGVLGRSLQVDALDAWRRAQNIPRTARLRAALWLLP
jgi:hypothetical protein